MEGQQKMDDHIDKLLNYIRYWQASGESLKTSARTKTRLSQIVQEGRFRGGIVPYGYRLEKQGRFNKKNHEVNEILIDPDEAAVVRIIFEKYVHEASAHSGCPGGYITTAISIEREPTSPIPPSSKC